jgi:Ca-activated chloride channel homolog
MRDLFLIHPERWPVLLLPLLLLGLGLLVRARSRRALAAFADEATQPMLLAVSGPKQRGWAFGLEIAGLFLLAFSALEPSWGFSVIEVERRGVDLVVCLDVSRSMQARDLAPSREQRAKRDVKALLPALRGDRVALVAFAGDARIVCPLTHDYAAFEQLMEELGPESTRRGGTNLGAALRSALALLPPDGAKSQTILLLTDGEDLEGQGLAEAARARSRGIRVHGIGYGTTQGSRVPKADGTSFVEDAQGNPVLSKMDAQGMRKLARSTGGVFVPAEGMAMPLVEVFNKRILPMDQRSYEGEERRRRIARYQWFLLPGMILLFASFLLSGRRKTRPARMGARNKKRAAEAVT